MLTDTINTTDFPPVSPTRLESDITKLVKAPDQRYVLGVIDINHYVARYDIFGPEYRNMVLNAIDAFLATFQSIRQILHHARSTEDQFTILYAGDILPHESLEGAIKREVIGEIIRRINSAEFPLLEAPEDFSEQYNPKHDVLLDRTDRSHKHILGTLDAQHVTVRGAAVAFKKGVSYPVLKGALLAELSLAKKAVYKEIEGGVAPNDITVHFHVLDRYV